MNKPMGNQWETNGDGAKWHKFIKSSLVIQTTLRIKKTNVL